MYLENIAELIMSKISEEQMPPENSKELFILYAILLRSKGIGVTESDVHDAWSAWMLNVDKEHESLVPFTDLAPEVQEQDTIFTNAIREVALTISSLDDKNRNFEQILFPKGLPIKDNHTNEIIELYKIMVTSSESLVSRRLSVNSFFLTMNGVLFTIYGLFTRTLKLNIYGIVGAIMLGAVGCILSITWKSLIKSFGQLNTGKFKVIEAIERYLPVSIYTAEWEALGKGKDPKIYKSFTSREMWVPVVMIFVHALAPLVLLVLSNMQGSNLIPPTTIQVAHILKM